MTRRNVEAQIATLTENDVLIVPDLGGVSTTDFQDFAKAIEPGRKAAHARLDELRKFAVTEVEYANLYGSRPQAASQGKRIDRIRLNNRSGLSDQFILSRLPSTTAGAILNTAALEQDIANVYGLELFQNVRYRVTEEEGETILNLSVEERSWGPGYFQFGAEYDSNGAGETLFNVGFSYIKTALNPSGGEWRTGFQLGSESAFFTEVHQPLPNHSMFFVNPSLGYEEQSIALIQNDDVIAAFDGRDSFAQVGFGREFGQWGEARIGVRYGDGKVERQIGDPELSDFDFRRGEAFVRFSIDEWDSLNFPKRGTIASAEWLTSRGSLGADTEFDQVMLNAGVAATRGRTSVVLNVNYNVTTNGTAPEQNVFRLGGFGRLSGLTANQIGGQHSAIFNAILYRQMMDHALFPIYTGITFEQGNAWSSRGDISLGDSLSTGSVWLRTETLLGPIYFAYGRAEGGEDSLYFFMGRPF
ncbi:MAG: hypothetical protein AB8G18_02640 [Gammaproteobacteria bacterium]